MLNGGGFDSYLPEELARRLRAEADRLECEPEEVLRQLLERALPQTVDPALAQYVDGDLLVQLFRLTDRQVAERYDRTVPIFEDFHLAISLCRGRASDPPGWGLGAMLVATEALCGKSGEMWDDYKGSFSFWFELTVHRPASRFRYLFSFEDYKGWPAMRFFKLLDPGDTHRGPRAYIPALEAEFSTAEMSRFASHFYGFLQGYFEATRSRYTDDFTLYVPAVGLTYGFRDGEFFEERETEDGAGDDPDDNEDSETEGINDQGWLPSDYPH